MGACSCGARGGTIVAAVGPQTTKSPGGAGVPDGGTGAGAGADHDRDDATPVVGIRAGSAAAVAGAALNAIATISVGSIRHSIPINPLPLDKLLKRLEEKARAAAAQQKKPGGLEDLQQQQRQEDEADGGYKSNTEDENIVEDFEDRPTTPVITQLLQPPAQSSSTYTDSRMPMEACEVEILGDHHCATA